jgi:hypothetical protein
MRQRSAKPYPLKPIQLGFFMAMRVFPAHGAYLKKCKIARFSKALAYFCAAAKNACKPALDPARIRRYDTNTRPHSDIGFA